MQSGNLIATHRNGYQLTQEELAQQVRVSRQTIAMWETGKQLPSDNVAVITARRLKLNEEELLAKVRWDRLHQRVDQLEQQYNADITVRPARESHMPHLREEVSQTVQGVTLSLVRIYKSIYFDDGSKLGGGTSWRIEVPAGGKPQVYHPGEQLILHLIRENTNDAIKLGHYRFYLEDNLGNLCGCRGSGSPPPDGKRLEIVAAFDYDPEATSFMLRYDVVNTHEDDCDTLHFDSVPLHGEVVEQTLGDDIIRYDGVHWNERWQSHCIKLWRNLAPEVRHIGPTSATDNLGNKYRVGGGWGTDKSEDNWYLSGITMEAPDPDATTLSFKYLFARTILTFELSDLPLPR